MLLLELKNYDEKQIEIFLKKKGRTTRFINKKLWMYIFFISYIHHKTQFEDLYDNGDDYVHIKSKELSELFGRERRNGKISTMISVIRKDLKEMGILSYKILTKVDATNIYEPLTFKKVYYKLNDELRSGGWFLSESIMNKKVEHYIDKPIILKPRGIYKTLKDELNQITIDTECAYTYLNDFYKDKNLVSKKMRPLSASELGIYKRHIDLLKIKTIELKISDVVCRVYHKVANFPKILRQCLKFHNESLVEIDVSNCHPLLLVKILDTTKIDKYELGHYQRMCESGNLYCFLNVEAEGMGFKINAKKQLLTKFLNSSNRAQSDVRKTFTKCFPSITKAILEFKRKNGYEEMARSLQRLESELMIERSLSKCYADKIHCFNIHDALYCTEKDVDAVNKHFSSSCAELGLNCETKIKYLF